MSDSIPSQSSSLDDWLCYLEQLHPSNIEMGLERVEKVAKQIGLLDTRSKIILIAGTNGKGTTAQCLEKLLLAQGFSVGTYASPHLIRYNERVRINGAELDDQYHVDAFFELEQGRGDTALTYFEYGTLGALAIFKRMDVDYVLLEVGLGGRFDATNIVDPIASVITTVDLDHKEYLGDTRELVGYDKAGIFRAGIPAIVGDLDIPHTVVDYGEHIDADLCLSKRDFFFNEDELTFSWKMGEFDLCFAQPAIPAQNAATALSVLYKLDLLPDATLIADCLKQLHVQGRFQQLSSAPLVYTDVAHNRESARFLAKRLNSFKEQGFTIHAVVGMLADKEHGDVIEAMTDSVDAWHVASLHNFRGTQATELAKTLSQYVPIAGTYDQVEDAIKTVMPQLGEQQLLIIFGSFYTVAQAITFFKS
ncbi:bifunctional tetrahydrofolate synthase/dihydrofolate synthase [Pseudoalteromonas sp. SSDWG2]|uniref:bifunctional tetrahydrofolate synthase/dihydrofolate synthase n=1 Tax=Pseudoalteromonas sp. SSDWG2 TaxID=3139391 RepID=UPI003BAB2DA9